MRKLLCYSVILGSLLAAPLAARAAPGDSGLTDERRTEAALLNRRVDAGGLVQKQRLAAGWQRLTLSGAPVTVLNLWSRSCKPCLEELPALGKMMQQYPAVPFLFVADPPTETSREEIARFWVQPIVELPPGHCKPAVGVVPPRGGDQTCRLTLPDTPPARSEDERLIRSLARATVRPITVLLDRDGVVRQAFVGSLLQRTEELGQAIERLRTLQAADGATGPRPRR